MRNDKSSPTTTGWPAAGDYRRSIRWEFSLYLSGVIVILMVITGFILTERYVEEVTDGVVDRLLVQSRSYARSAGKHLLSAHGPDVLMLNDLCKKFGEDHSSLFWVGIAGADGVVLAHTDFRSIVAGTSLPEVSGIPPRFDLRSGEALRLDADTVSVSIPISENGIQLGRLAAAASTQEIVDARREAIIAVATVALVMVLVGVTLASFTLHRKLRPITAITQKLRDVDLDDIRIDVPVSSHNEFGYLAETLRVMGEKLNLAQLERTERARIARELEIAREIQGNILPRSCPEYDSCEFAVAYESALEVGGDYYDFLPIDERRLALLVADVSGKSLPGMLVMLMTRDIVRRHSFTITEPSGLLCRVNRELLPGMRKGTFVTMFYGIIDVVDGSFSFASAGHNPLLHLSSQSGQSTQLNPKGYPLGLMPDDVFARRITTQTLRLSPGDWLIQYTDGVNEAHNTTGEEFGMERFEALLADQTSANADELISATLGSLRGFVGEAPQYDDITLLAMKWRGVNADTRVRSHQASGFAG